jgi:hypothetical protein
MWLNFQRKDKALTVGSERLLMKQLDPNFLFR